MSLSKVVPALLLSLPLGLPADEVRDTSYVDPETLIRLVVKAQQLAEKRLSAYTFDQREVETKYGKDGRPKETVRRLFYVLSGDDESGGSRELVEVDGRPATPDEKKDAAEKDEKGRQQRLKKLEDLRGKGPPKVTGEGEDPLVGTRRLSDLINRFDYSVGGEVLVDGRPTYILDFTPKMGLVSKGVGDKALNALAGRALIDATDFQVRAVDAHLTTPLKIAGGLAANVHEAVVSYKADLVLPEHWFPCVIDLRLRGKAVLFFRVDTGFRYEFAGFQRFEVAMESKVGSEGSPPTP